MNQSTMSILMLVAIVAIMYFLMIRPQKKKEKEINAMRNGIQAGDEVVTIGGFCGRVVKAKDETVIIQLGADKTKVEIMRWGISKVVDSAAKPVETEEAPVKKPSRPKRMKAAATEEAPVEAPVEEVVETVEAEVVETVEDAE